MRSFWIIFLKLPSLTAILSNEAVRTTTTIRKPTSLVCGSAIRRIVALVKLEHTKFYSTIFSWCIVASHSQQVVLDLQGEQHSNCDRKKLLLPYILERWAAQGVATRASFVVNLLLQLLYLHLYCIDGAEEGYVLCFSTSRTFSPARNSYPLRSTQVPFDLSMSVSLASLRSYHRGSDFHGSRMWALMLPFWLFGFGNEHTEGPTLEDATIAKRNYE
jgi:hypothetical protein